MPWRLTGGLLECSREIGLAGEAQRERNVDSRLVTTCQKLLRALKTPRTDVAMGRLPDSLPEGAREMVSAQGCDRCHVIKGETAFKVCLDVIQHTEQSASIKPSSCEKCIELGR